jgi:hypothetical protein
MVGKTEHISLKAVTIYDQEGLRCAGPSEMGPVCRRFTHNPWRRINRRRNVPVILRALDAVVAEDHRVKDAWKVSI